MKLVHGGGKVHFTTNVCAFAILTIAFAQSLCFDRKLENMKLICLFLLLCGQCSLSIPSFRFKIAAEISDEYEIFSEGLPRYYLDVPLIFSEGLPR